MPRTVQVGASVYESFPAAYDKAGNLATFTGLITAQWCSPDGGTTYGSSWTISGTANAKGRYSLLSTGAAWPTAPSTPGDYRICGSGIDDTGRTVYFSTDVISVTVTGAENTDLGSQLTSDGLAAFALSNNVEAGQLPQVSVPAGQCEDSGSLYLIRDNDIIQLRPQYTSDNPEVITNYIDFLDEVSLGYLNGVWTLSLGSANFTITQTSPLGIYGTFTVFSTGDNASAALTAANLTADRVAAMQRSTGAGATAADTPSPGDAAAGGLPAGLAQTGEKMTLADSQPGTWAAAVSTFIAAVGSMIEYVSSLWRFKASALSQAPGGSVTVLPGYVSATGGTPTTTLPPAFQHRYYQTTFPVLDANGNPINLTGVDLTIDFYLTNTPDVATMKATTTGSPNGTIVISGNQCTVTLPGSLLTTVGTFNLILSPTADNANAYTSGTLTVNAAPPI